ncbi:hypothetical protein O3G_MSEX000682 [Manduca sexta]|nr:hypothetical protein O3G_MSEX000682 [Manduca sexta]
MKMLKRKMMLKAMATECSRTNRMREVHQNQKKPMKLIVMLQSRSKISPMATRLILKMTCL